MQNRQALYRVLRLLASLGAGGRYIMIWITALPQALGEAHVTDGRATRLATG